LHSILAKVLPVVGVFGKAPRLLDHVLRVPGHSLVDVQDQR
jgi:hypothetical protein